MGVRITDEETVALYDSTSGVAFGPTFRSEAEAEDFLVWCEFRARPREAGTFPSLRVTNDPRNMPPAELHWAVARFREDEEAWGNDRAADDVSLTDWLVAEGR